MTLPAKWDTVDVDGERVLVRRSRGVIDGVSFTWRGRHVRCESTEHLEASGAPTSTVWHLMDGPALAAWIPGTVAPAAEDLVRWITARLEAKHGSAAAVSDERGRHSPAQGMPATIPAGAEPRLIRSIKIVLTPRATLPSPDDAAKRLATLSDRLAAFTGGPATWGVESKGRFSLSVSLEQATIPEESLDAFLVEFHAEAHQLGFKSTKNVTLE